METPGSGTRLKSFACPNPKKFLKKVGRKGDSEFQKKNFDGFFEQVFHDSPLRYNC